MSLHELTDEQQRDPRRSRGASPTRRSRRTRREWDRDHTFPRELFAELGELGLMGVCVPEEHGGAGADFLSYVLVLEELVARRRRRRRDRRRPHERLHAAAARARLAQLRARAGLGRGDRRLRADRGRLGLGRERDAHARTPTAGITGAKQWITNGSHASTFLVFARDGERISAFVVRAGADGFAVTREEEKMGLNSSSTADLAFEDTPAERLGEPGQRACGSRCARSTAGGSGSPRRRSASRRPRSTLATGYAKERNAFGGPIGGSARSSRSSPTCRPRSRPPAR